MEIVETPNWFFRNLLWQEYDDTDYHTYANCPKCINRFNIVKHQTEDAYNTICPNCNIKILIDNIINILNDNYFRLGEYEIRVFESEEDKTNYLLMLKITIQEKDLQEHFIRTKVDKEEFKIAINDIQKFRKLVFKYDYDVFDIINTQKYKFIIADILDKPTRIQGDLLCKLIQTNPDENFENINNVFMIDNHLILAIDKELDESLDNFTKFINANSDGEDITNYPENFIAYQPMNNTTLADFYCDVFALKDCNLYLLHEQHHWTHIKMKKGQTIRFWLSLPERILL